MYKNSWGDNIGCSRRSSRCDRSRRARQKCAVKGMLRTLCACIYVYTYVCRICDLVRCV